MLHMLGTDTANYIIKGRAPAIGAIWRPSITIEKHNRAGSGNLDSVISGISA